MREAVAIAVHLLDLFTLYESTVYTNAPPVDESDYSHIDVVTMNMSTCRAEIFPIFPLHGMDLHSQLVHMAMNGS